MLNQTLEEKTPRLHAQTDDFFVHIVSIAKSVPEHSISQDEVRDEVAPYLAGHERMLAAFANSGVNRRHMIKPVSWYHEPHDWVERTGVFREAAFALALEAAEKSLAEASVDPAEIDGIVLVTSTGITIPTLDARIAHHLGMPPDVERTPIVGLGCAGGATGLARAAQLAGAKPGATILLLAVEVCSVNLSLLNIGAVDAIGFTLFGDGAVAMVLRSEGVSGGPGTLAGPRYLASGERMWPRTEGLAGITVRSDSLGLELSPALVPFLRENLKPAAHDFLARHSLGFEDLSGFVLHAGASRMIDAAAESLGIDAARLQHSRSVLSDYGNLSACSVLFVLQSTMIWGASGPHLMAAFGPGFTMSFVLVDL